MECGGSVSKLSQMKLTVRELGPSIWIQPKPGVAQRDKDFILLLEKNNYFATFKKNYVSK